MPRTSNVWKVTSKLLEKWTLKILAAPSQWPRRVLWRNCVLEWQMIQDKHSPAEDSSEQYHMDFCASHQYSRLLNISTVYHDSYLWCKFNLSLPNHLTSVFAGFLCNKSIGDTNAVCTFIHNWTDGRDLWHFIFQFGCLMSSCFCCASSCIHFLDKLWKIRLNLAFLPRGSSHFRHQPEHDN